MTSPRVAIDLHMVGERETGNETYGRQLAAALVMQDRHDYLLYTPRPEALADDLRPHARVYRDVPAPVRLLWTYPRLLRADQARLIHVQYVGPEWTRCPVVVTVHDLTYHMFPEFFSRRDKVVLGNLVGRTLRKAAAVLVPSDSARRDLLRFYPVPDQLVTVTPEAAAKHFRPQAPEDVERVRARYGLGPRYVLAVGNLQPRKNLERLLAAFASLASFFNDVQLAIVGQRGRQAGELDDSLRRMGLESRVRFTGYVPDGDLPAIYSGAEVFCYPSLYEGFGLPVLEAMACGAPVVTSDVSSLPEVVGNAAILVPPTSISDIARALSDLLLSKELQSSMRQSGMDRASQFSWERTAAITADVYDAVLRGSPEAAGSHRLVSNR